MTEPFDEDMAEAAKKFVNELVSAIAGPPQAEDELQRHLDTIFKFVKYHKIPETSKIKGEVQLTLRSEQADLYSRVLVDETCIWSSQGETGQSQVAFFMENYPNFPTEYPLKLMVGLVNCKLPWELVTFRRIPGFQLKVYRDESQQELVPKNFQADHSPTGQLFWGDGNGKVEQVPLWASYTLPES